MEDPRIISALFIFLKMAYYNVLINTFGSAAPSDIRIPAVFFSGHKQTGFCFLSASVFPDLSLPFHREIHILPVGIGLQQRYFFSL